MMTDTLRNRISITEHADEPPQHLLLPFFKRNVITAFKLDPDGEIVTTLPAVPLRGACMPGP